MAYRLSRFCHFVSGKTDGLTAVYNALTLGVVIVDVEIAERLRSLSQGMISADKLETLLLPEVLQQLIQHKLVLPSESQTDLADYLQIQQGLECRRIGILYLMLTDACNLACRYCFVENAMPQYYKFSLMTEATAKEALDLFVKCLASSDTIEEPQIIFYVHCLQDGNQFLSCKRIVWISPDKHIYTFLFHEPGLQLITLPVSKLIHSAWQFPVNP